MSILPVVFVQLSLQLSLVLVAGVTAFLVRRLHWKEWAAVGLVLSVIPLNAVDQHRAGHLDYKHEAGLILIPVLSQAYLELRLPVVVGVHEKAGVRLDASIMLHCLIQMIVAALATLGYYLYTFGSGVDPPVFADGLVYVPIFMILAVCIVYGRFYASARLDGMIIAAVRSARPLLSILVGWTVLSEPWTPTGLVCVFLYILSVGFTTWYQRTLVSTLDRRRPSLEKSIAPIDPPPEVVVTLLDSTDEGDAEISQLVRRSI
jgi:drug/metabolite transporter (DMT)-like permease